MIPVNWNAELRLLEREALGDLADEIRRLNAAIADLDARIAAGERGLCAERQRLGRLLQSALLNDLADSLPDMRAVMAVAADGWMRT